MTKEKAEMNELFTTLSNENRNDDDNDKDNYSVDVELDSNLSDEDENSASPKFDAELDKEKPKVSEENPLIKAYKAKYKNEDNDLYTDGHGEPWIHGNRVQFSFADEEDAVNFFLEQAQQGHKFKLYDAKKPGEVIAFSDGTCLRRPPEPNGEIIQPDEKFEPEEDNQQRHGYS